VNRGGVEEEANPDPLVIGSLDVR